MAVPTGEYELIARVDLSPVYGVLEHRETVKITRPPPDLLERRLEELKSEDPRTRRKALRELRYFPEQARQVVPHLVRILKSDDEKMRALALSVLVAYPKLAARRIALILSIAAGKGTDEERGAAAHLLGQIAPKHRQVEATLAKGAKETKGSLKKQFEGALSRYRRRHRITAPGGR